MSSARYLPGCVNAKNFVGVEMNDDLIDVIEDFDLQTALAEAERTIFRYEILLASLTSRIIGGLYLLGVLLCIIFGTAFLYLAPSRYEIGASLWHLLPSLLVVLFFAIASTARWMQTLHTAKREGRIALDLQVVAQRRVLEELQRGTA